MTFFQSVDFRAQSVKKRERARHFCLSRSFGTLNVYKNAEPVVFLTG